MDTVVNADNKEQSPVEETDDSCILEFIEITPLTRDTDGSSITEVKMADLKQEPLDVPCAFYSFCVYFSSQQKELV